MTLAAGQRNPSPSGRKILVDRVTPAMRGCPMNIPDRKAAFS